MDRREFAMGILSLPLTGHALSRSQSSSHKEPPTLLWELLALLPTQSADGQPIELTNVRAEMIFPGELRSTLAVTAGQVRPILEADSKHMPSVSPVPANDGLTEFCGVALDRLDAIGVFKPCTIVVGDFDTDDVHAAWKLLGYVKTEDPDIWLYKGSAGDAEAAQTRDELVELQRRLTLPARGSGSYRFLTLIDHRYIVASHTGSILRQIRAQYADRDHTGSPPDVLFGDFASIPASTGHVAALYEGRKFVSDLQPESPTERLNILQRQNTAALTSIETELGQMPRIRAALLGITPGAPWRDPLNASELPEIASTSLVSIQLEDADEAERYLSIARARFDALVSWYTETPYLELFSFNASASGSRVAIELGHLWTPRYDVIQMSYFNDLTFLTWEPDDRET